MMIARGSSASTSSSYACVMSRALVSYAKTWRRPSWSRHVTLARVQLLLIRYVTLHRGTGVILATL